MSDFGSAVLKGSSSVRNLLQGPLFIVIPLMATVIAVAIGVSIGLTNLWMNDAFDSKIAPVISAGTVTILIMGIAGYLSITSPDPEEQSDSH